MLSIHSLKSFDLFVVTMSWNLFLINVIKRPLFGIGRPQFLNSLRIIFIKGKIYFEMVGRRGNQQWNEFLGIGCLLFGCYIP